MFELINNLAGQNPFLDWVVIFLAVWAIWIMAVNYIWDWWRESASTRYWHLVVVITTLALIYSIGFIIGYVWFEPRPFVNGRVNLLIPEPWSQKSFPSDHAAVAFALAVASWRLGVKKSGWKMFRPWLVASLVALARVYVGVHYFWDVVAGAALGFIVSWLVFRWFDKNLHRLRRVL